MCITVQLRTKRSQNRNRAHTRHLRSWCRFPRRDTCTLGTVAVSTSATVTLVVRRHRAPERSRIPPRFRAATIRMRQTTAPPPSCLSPLQPLTCRSRNPQMQRRSVLAARLATRSLRRTTVRPLPPQSLCLCPTPCRLVRRSFSAMPSQASCSGTATVVCSLGTLASGGAATVALVVTAPSTADLPRIADASRSMDSLR